jgi:hypothetical protein
MFYGNEIKTTNKICGFLLQSTYNYSYFLQTVCLIILHVPLDLPSLGNPIIMIQNYNAPWIVPILNALFIQIMLSPYPLNKNPSKHMIDQWLAIMYSHVHTYNALFGFYFFFFFCYFSMTMTKTKRNQDCGRNLILCLICS